MLEMVNSLLEWKYWDAILSILVIVHLISEYGHYIWEFVSGRRESNILKDIQIHRKKSTKTYRLACIQADLHLIKQELKIGE